MIMHSVRHPLRRAALLGLLALAAGGTAWAEPGSGAVAGSVEPPPQFASICAVCHGGDGGGTDRAPALLNNRRLRSQSELDIAALIRSGRNNMPAFASLPDEQIQALSHYVHSLNAAAFDLKPPGDTAAGAALFFGAGHCSECHTAQGQGGTNGPDLSGIGRQLTLADLHQAIDHPATRYVTGYARVTVTLTDGTALRGFARNQGVHSLDLQSLDGRMHLLRDDEYTAIAADTTAYAPAFSGSDEQRRDLVAFLSTLGGVGLGPLPAGAAPPSAAAIADVLHPPSGDWPTYSGDVNGNRHSALAAINTQNVATLQPAWIFPTSYTPLETTPLVVDGVMYVTAPNQVIALDGRTGSQIWSYTRPRSVAAEISGDAAKGAQRGAAILGDRLFFITDNAHLICLQRLTGALLWDVAMPGQPGKYGGTSAPLVIGDLVIAGVSGGDEGIRGFVAAYRASTGEQAWRFWTVPQAGEPAAKSWAGNPAPQGGSTWTTGSFDPQTGVLYIATGNPYPDTDGDHRGGDNLYTDSDIALDAKTGKLLWSFQFTPHDVHDWDANQPLVLVDAPFHGHLRKLLLHANRNGFFYVLDRTTGKFLQGSAFVKKLTWASRIGADGRPVLLPGSDTTDGGVKTCPAVRGATNWYSTAFDPATGLYYVMSVEDCTIYRKAHDGGYVFLNDPADPPHKVLRALSVETGQVAWELPMIGYPEKNYSGVLSTAGGLVFFGETGGGIAAADARTGKPLWHFEANEQLKGSPMTYLAGGRQYIAIAAGPNILAFAVP